jgi:hypothetical protein
MAKVFLATASGIPSRRLHGAEKQRWAKPPKLYETSVLVLSKVRR